METGETQHDSTPRWEAIAEEFLAPVPLEEVVQPRRPNSIADPIGYMRSRDPRRAAEMQQRRDNLVAQRDLSAQDPRLRSFRMGSTIGAPVETAPPEKISASLRQARRLVGIVRDANRGWPELAKRNPELAAEFRAETQAILDCKRRAASDSDLLDMRID